MYCRITALPSVWNVPKVTPEHDGVGVIVGVNVAVGV